VPVTVLIGDAPHETGVGPEEVAALEALGPLVHTEHLSGVGHFIHEEVPNDVRQLLLGAHGRIADNR
jgi:pimeloyl-ACP methyl ester carboxylesterase